MARIFITGSAQGLGLMTGQLLAEGGHEVVLHARDAARAAATRAALPAVAGMVEGDVATLAGMRAVAAQVNAFGSFDAVIHNVAIGYREPRRDITADGLPALFATNVLAPYALTAPMQAADRDDAGPLQHDRLRRRHPRMPRRVLGRVPDRVGLSRVEAPTQQLVALGRADRHHPVAQTHQDRVPVEGVVHGGQHRHLGEAGAEIADRRPAHHVRVHDIGPQPADHPRQPDGRDGELGGLALVLGQMHMAYARALEQIDEAAAATEEPDLVSGRGLFAGQVDSDVDAAVGVVAVLRQMHDSTPGTRRLNVSEPDQPGEIRR